METITIRLVAAPATTNRAAYDLEGRTYERQAIPRVGEWVQDGMYTTDRGRLSRSTVWLVVATAILAVGLTATLF